MARPNKGVDHVAALAGDRQSKRRLEVILGTIADWLPVNDACERLGIRHSYFRELRTRALAGALVAIAPRRIGRPRRLPKTPAEVAALQRENAELRREVANLKAQVEVASVLAQSPVEEPGRGKRRSGRGQAAAGR